MGADESWPMIEEAVYRLFDELAAKNPGGHVALGPPLDELGWSDIETEFPTESWELLFRAQGRSMLNSDCLARIMLVELKPVLDGPVDGIVLPTISSGHVPGTDTDDVRGVLLGPLPRTGRLVVPVTGRGGTVSVGVVDAEHFAGERLNTFDTSAHWTTVRGPHTGDVVAAGTEWGRAIATAHRALATELVALADQALRIAVEHVTVRVQFGSPIGSFQSPRHLLADASARLEGARAVLGETWHYCGNPRVAPLLPAGGELSALIAKATAGRAHRVVSDAVLQVCGAIGLTREHDLHRYVARGFQIDALLGSHQRLETLLSERLFTDYTPGRALPAIVSWAK